jgi:hypothetical protein
MNKKTKHILLTFYLWGGLGLAFLALGVWMYWSLYPYQMSDIIIFKDDSHRMTETVLHQGDETTYLVDYCKFENPPATVEKFFIDGITFRSADAVSKLQLGCHKELVPLSIPTTLPPGQYKYQIIAAYQVNPIRKLILVRETNQFTVLRAEEGAYGPTPSQSNLVK